VFEKVNQKDIVIGSLLMVLIVFLMQIPVRTIEMCPGSCEGDWYDVNAPSVIIHNSTASSHAYQGSMLICSPSMELCKPPVYVEPFSQYFNLRLLLMLLAGPGVYLFRNRTDARHSLEALLVLFVLFVILYSIAYISLPVILRVILGPHG
jgi:hypothetical protein